MLLLLPRKQTKPVSRKAVTPTRDFFWEAEKAPHTPDARTVLFSDAVIRALQLITSSYV